MRSRQKLTLSATIAIFFLVLSMFMNIVPCRTAPNVPNPQFKWQTCDLNPDKGEAGMQKQYLGYTKNIRESYVLVLAVTFLASFLILSLISKKKRIN